jgi:uncharacterized metal-binding protein YceD (DUF177 family)
MHKEFIIPFIGLKVGKHHFEFEIDDTFFESMEYSIIQKGNVKVELELDKKETMLIATFDVEGVVETLCDRCNTPMDLEIQGSYKLVYKFGLEEEEDEMLIVLHPDSYQIDVTTPIYELITSQLPLRAIHDDGECDEEMWGLIQKHTINANVDEEEDWDDEDWIDDEGDDDDEEENLDSDEGNSDDDRPIDPRWSILKNLN